MRSRRKTVRQTSGDSLSTQPNPPPDSFTLERASSPKPSMATSTAIPGVRRLCALASPLPFAPAAQLVKPSNLNEPRIATDVESHLNPPPTPRRARSSLKRTRDARDDASAINSRTRQRPAAHHESASLDPCERFRHRSAQRDTANDSRNRSCDVSPTPRSGALSSRSRSRTGLYAHVRLTGSRTHAPATSVRLQSPQNRHFASTRSQPKPALAYHDLAAANVSPTSTGSIPSTVDAGSQRGTSTVAESVTARSETKENAADPPRPWSLPPRPPSPYGEINELIRHPTLYDPILKPRHPIVLCHGTRGVSTLSHSSCAN